MRNILGIVLQVIAALLAIGTIIGVASGFGPLETVALFAAVLLLAVAGYKLWTTASVSAPTAN